MSQKYIETMDGTDGPIMLRHDWVIDNSAAIQAGIRGLSARGRVIDATGIGRIDLWGAMTLKELGDAAGGQLILSGRQQRLFDFIPLDKTDLPRPDRKPQIVETIEGLGKIAVDGAKTSYGILAFVGEIAVCFLRNILRPRAFRFHSIVRHIEETGLRALPIIGLLAVLISMVISYQAAMQLQKFGASIFTIDLTVISLLREMGVLVTAIMVAGRSGSAFAAEIGVMKLREEVDALKTMGFDPIEILVLPRLIAMLITLPILTFLADLIGLAGSGLISMILLDIPIDQYIDRVDMVATFNMFFAGMIKAPVFAFVITVIGTYNGMNASGSAESVGRLTTISVVQSIFLVIMFDALFSIVFSKMGI